MSLKVAYNHGNIQYSYKKKNWYFLKFVILGTFLLFSVVWIKKNCQRFGFCHWLPIAHGWSVSGQWVVSGGSIELNEWSVVVSGWSVSSQWVVSRWLVVVSGQWVGQWVWVCFVWLRLLKVAKVCVTFCATVCSNYDHIYI